MLTALFAVALIGQAALAAEGVRNVVLVPGAWADGSSWAKAMPLLEKAGLNAVAVQNLLTSLADDLAATKRAIALQDGRRSNIRHRSPGGISRLAIDLGGSCQSSRESYGREVGQRHRDEGLTSLLVSGQS